MYVSKVVGILLSLVLITGIAMAKETTNTTKYQKKIEELENQVAQLKAEVEKLKSENEMLKSKLKSEENWDVRKLMDELFIYHITPYGKRYDLLFHEGGLGGVAVYQYVGPWLGDAGKWRQYKQIAQLKTTQLQHGYLRPGLVLKPVWGFNKSNITIRSIGDLLRLERELNNVNGLAKYVEWLRTNYVKSTRYNTGVLVTCVLVALGVGMVLGEVTTPVSKLSERATVSAMTYFGETRRTLPKLLLTIVGCIIVGVILSTVLPLVISGLVTITLTLVVLVVGRVVGAW